MCSQLAKKLHPDANKGDADAERFQEVQRAYEVILCSVLILFFCEFSRKLFAARLYMLLKRFDMNICPFLCSKIKLNINNYLFFVDSQG
jgi:DnaJ domain